ncbi:hypothetical protein ACF0H5_012247 [Mactra antiquata]
MIDLVNDVLRQRKSSNPHGWEQFSRGLRDVNVPQEVVGNKRRWSWIQNLDRYKESDEEEDDQDQFYESFSSPAEIKTEKWEPY